jgi:pyruvate carboxylase
MGQTPGGFPPEVQRRILRNVKPVKGRPGESLPPADFSTAEAAVEKMIGRKPTGQDVVSYLLYPRVFQDYVTHLAQFSDISMLPTPYFLYGQQPGEEFTIDIEPGKTLIIKLLTVGEPHPDGTRTVFFELNGQPRSVSVVDKSIKAETILRPKADPTDPKQIAAPMPGLVVTVPIKAGDTVKKGQKLLSLEAMKMETTLYADNDGRVANVLVKPGTPVEAGELVVQME